MSVVLVLAVVLLVVFLVLSGNAHYHYDYIAINPCRCSLVTLFLIGPTEIFAELKAAAQAELDANGMAMVMNKTYSESAPHS